MLIGGKGSFRMVAERKPAFAKAVEENEIDGKCLRIMGAEFSF